MSRAKITELMQEIDALASDADYLHELLTTEAGKHWLGEAEEACLRESGDNREAALQAIAAYRAWAEEAAEHVRPIPDPDDRPALSLDFLL